VLHLAFQTKKKNQSGVAQNKIGKEEKRATPRRKPRLTSILLKLPLEVGKFLK